MTITLTKPKLVLAGACVLGAGLLVAAFNFMHLLNEQTNEVRGGLQQFALAFSPGEVAQLTSETPDSDTLLQRAIQARMSRVHVGNPEVGEVRIISYNRQNRKITPLVIYDPDLKAGENPPPAGYAPELDKRAMREIANGAQASTGVYLRPNNSCWVIAYIPLAKQTQDPGGAQTQEVLSYDLQFVPSNKDVVESTIERALAAWLVLGLTLGAYIMARRHAGQERTINRLNKAIEQSQSAIIILTVEGVLKYANNGFFRLTGFAPEEQKTINWPSLLVETPDMPAAIMARRQADVPWESEREMHRKNGEIFPVRLGVSPVRNPRGKTFAYIVTITDITESLRQTLGMLQAKQRAEEAERAKSTFLTTVSHEVRTPLNGILGFANLLNDTGLPPKQAALTEIIRENGEALVNLTSNILDLSRIESGRMPVVAEPCDLEALIDEVLEHTEEKAQAKQLHLMREITPGTPLAVLTDADLLRRVLVNFVENAITYTAEGEVSVRLRKISPNPATRTPTAEQPKEPTAKSSAEPADTPAGEQAVAPAALTLLFSIRDTGPGIPPEEATRFFQMLSQTEPLPQAGVGLGLTISQKFVHLLGGEICMESEKGKGTVFFFTIACRRADEADDKANEPRHQSSCR